MPGPKPPAVPLSEAERQELLGLIRAHTTPQHHSFRAHLLLALACEPPAASGRPSSHWTPRALADEACTRGMVATISKRQVGRFLTSGRSQAAPESLWAQCRT